MIDGIEAEDGGEAVGGTGEAVELIQGPLVCCARLVDRSSESAQTDKIVRYLHLGDAILEIKVLLIAREGYPHGLLLLQFI